MRKIGEYTRLIIIDNVYYLFENLIYLLLLTERIFVKLTLLLKLRIGCDQMENEPKLAAFVKLHNLIIYYSEYRDMPAEDDFDFFKEVEECCKALEINYKDFLKEMEF